MEKLNGKYTFELAMDIANMMDEQNIECGIYNGEPSVLLGSDKDNLELINSCGENGCSLYVSRPLSIEEQHVINDLIFIEKTFPKELYSGLRIALESEIDKDTRDNTIFYSQHIVGEEKYIIHHIPKEKTLTK